MTCVITYMAHLVCGKYIKGFKCSLSMVSVQCLVKWHDIIVGHQLAGAGTLPTLAQHLCTENCRELSHAFEQQQHIWVVLVSLMLTRTWSLKSAPQLSVLSYDLPTTFNVQRRTIVGPHAALPDKFGISS